MALASTSCAVLSSVRGVPPLFPSNERVHGFDFEADTLARPPDGFDSRRGQWSVADSPSAVSGTQVVVRGGEQAATLAIKEAASVASGAAEVSVRVFLGPSGAGISCDAESGAGYVMSLEAGSGRVALYRKASDGMALVDQRSAGVGKGEWARLGIRCQRDQVTGYLNGKPLLEGRGPIEAFALALHADPGVTAQFDDLKYWAKK